MPGFFGKKNRCIRIAKLTSVVFLFLFSEAKSQVFYSTDPAFIKAKTEQNNLLTRYWNAYPDTTITELSNVFTRNFMGNIGLPSPNYMLRYGTANLGFRLYDLPYYHDQVNHSELQYFKTKGPFVDLTGIKGRMNFQAFKMLYAQTFKTGFSIALKFARYSSAGYYDNQATTTQNFYASSNYETKNGRFGYYFYFLENDNKNAENGGLKAVTLNDTTAATSKNFLQVNLSASERSNKAQHAVFNPWIRLNKTKDSVPTTGHYIQIKSVFANNLYWYTDKGLPTDNYYKNSYLDTAKTNDSTRVRQFSNEINYTVKSADNQFGFSACYKNEINLLWQKYDSTFTNHIAQADVTYTNFDANDTSFHSGFESKLNVQYVANGPNTGNYKAETNFTWWFNIAKRRNLFFNALTEKRSADYIYNNWVTNNFLWFNKGLKNQTQSQVQAGIHVNPYLKISVFYQNIFNYLYFDYSAMPTQFKKDINNTGISVGFSKVLFRHLGLALSHTYQNTSHAKYYRVPAHITGGKLYYETNSKKNILQFQLGSQVQIFQSFTGYAYMPATQAFYLQDTYKTAACPFVDIFMNVRIRPVSIFFKMENILQGYDNLNYSFVPGYYQQERAFRFGISWVFFD